MAEVLKWHCFLGLHTFFPRFLKPHLLSCFPYTQIACWLIYVSLVRFDICLLNSWKLIIFSLKDPNFSPVIWCSEVSRSPAYVDRFKGSIPNTSHLCLYLATFNLLGYSLSWLVHLLILSSPAKLILGSPSKYEHVCIWPASINHFVMNPNKCPQFWVVIFGLATVLRQRYFQLWSLGVVGRN